MTLYGTVEARKLFHAVRVDAQRGVRLVECCVHEDTAAADKNRTMTANDALGKITAFAEGADPFAALKVPPPLEESLARHRGHLAELVHTMKMAGISDRQIEESVSVLIAAYKEELMAAIRRMKISAW